MNTIEKMKKAREEILKNSLFEDDEGFIKLAEEEEKKELIEKARNFLKIKIGKSCENCLFNKDDGMCHIMEQFNQDILIPTFEKEVCSRWKDNAEKA